MSPEHVHSIDDPRIAMFRDLPTRGSATAGSLFVAEGRLLVERLVASRYRTACVLVEQRRLADIQPLVPSGTTVLVATRELMRQILGFHFHQGVLACGVREPPLDLGGLLSEGRPRFLVAVCAHITDPENLGGILRNCAAFGVDAVLLSRHCPCPFSRRVLRVSMGSALRLAIAHSADLEADLHLLRHRWQAQLIAAVLGDQAQPLDSIDRRPPRLAILFGNEAHGLNPQWISRCDRTVTIPMQGGTDSLNVAVAAGVFLYHFTRCTVGEDDE